ncbi:hypothetical protein FCL47_09185 [Desulfopila sp. IMCC35006]|uniref:hypothetical protein n=1 Tax=Desulfopila sp. IMCC35006 TaxID=2569542 RepID=UPI0010ABC34D|nr:hypothetical protein [Desulfopila sp. IMCC35006]TKB26576.1 hypothetical protein FCL47_09185 [Desulfopila sp. IMCC35006]
MQWNLDKIRFLYPPDDFTGSFTNEKMQARHKALQDQKIKEILTQLESAANPLQAMRVLNPREHIQFLLNNIETFKQQQCLEKAVLWLYYQKNTPFAAAGDFNTWKFLLNECDADRLYQEGSPFPFEKVTAYRGSATGIRKGLSWTVSREKAAWILDRWEDKELGGGTVFALEITRADILVYIEDEMKQEVILLPEVAETAQVRAITSL